MARKADAIAVVESAYHLDETGGDELWARGVLDAFRPLLDRGLGVGDEQLIASTAMNKGNA